MKMLKAIRDADALRPNKLSTPRKAEILMVLEHRIEFGPGVRRRRIEGLDLRGRESRDVGAGDRAARVVRVADGYAALVGKSVCHGPFLYVLDFVRAN